MKTEMIQAVRVRGRVVGCFWRTHLDSAMSKFTAMAVLRSGQNDPLPPIIFWNYDLEDRKAARAWIMREYRAHKSMYRPDQMTRVMQMPVVDVDVEANL